MPTNSTWGHIQTFALHPWVGISFSALVIVASWKMNATGANAVLLLAWGMLGISFFRFEVISNQELISRLLWTALFSSAVGLLIYYILWTKSPLVRPDIATISPKATIAAEIIASPTPPLASTLSAASPIVTTEALDSGLYDLHALNLNKEAKDLQAKKEAAVNNRTAMVNCYPVFEYAITTLY